MSTRKYVRSGSPYEDKIGFSRAVRVGKRVLVSGTAPVWPTGEVNPDPYAQSRRCLEIIGQALCDAGACLDDVVRTRTYLVDATFGEPAARAHREVFGQVRPVSTMVVVVGFLDKRWKVEFDAEAIVDG